MDLVKIRLVVVVLVAVLFTLLFSHSMGASNALKCYTGFKFIGGQSFGSDETMTCDDDSDYCYNATARGGVLINIAKAGCSTYRCMLARDSCFNTDIQGVPVSFCCCSTDLCNARDNSHPSLLQRIFH